MRSSDDLEEIEAIFDAVLENTARQLTRIELRLIKPPPDAKDVVSVYLTTVGEVEARLILQLDRSLMHALTSAMSRGKPLSNEDAIDYIKEFFNIFCGHLAAALRQVTKKRARFGIAHFSDGPLTIALLPDANTVRRCYAAEQGVLRLCAFWR